MKRIGLLFIMSINLSVIGQTEVYKLKIENTPNGSLTNDVLLSKKPSGLVRQLDTSVFLDNTDNQILSVDGQDLTISGGNTITLPSSPVSVSNGLTTNPLTGDAELGGVFNKTNIIDLDGNTFALTDNSNTSFNFNVSESQAGFNGLDSFGIANTVSFGISTTGGNTLLSEGSTNMVSDDFINIQSNNNNVNISANSASTSLSLSSGIATLSANGAAYINAPGEIALTSGVVRLETPTNGYIDISSGGAMLLGSSGSMNLTADNFVNIQSSAFTQISGGVVDGYVNLEAADVRLNPRVGKTPEIGDTWVCTNTDGSGEWSTPPVGFTGSFPSGSGATEVTVTVVNGLITDIQ